MFCFLKYSHRTQQLSTIQWLILPIQEVKISISFQKPDNSRTSQVTGLFWTISLSHNMASFYIVSPLMIFLMYTYFPKQQFGTNACYWTYWFYAVGMWSWTIALYPLHKLQQLTTLKNASVSWWEKTHGKNWLQVISDQDMNLWSLDVWDFVDTVDGHLMWNGAKRRASSFWHKSLVPWFTRQNTAFHRFILGAEIQSPFQSLGSIVMASWHRVASPWSDSILKPVAACLPSLEFDCGVLTPLRFTKWMLCYMINALCCMVRKWLMFAFFWINPQNCRNVTAKVEDEPYQKIPWHLCSAQTGWLAFQPKCFRWKHMFWNVPKRADKFRF